MVGVVTVQPNATKGAVTNVAMDESRSNNRQHSRGRLPAKRRSPWVRTEGVGAVARQLRTYVQEKDNGDRVPTAVVVIAHRTSKQSNTDQMQGKARKRRGWFLLLD